MVAPVVAGQDCFACCAESDGAASASAAAAAAATRVRACLVMEGSGEDGATEAPRGLRPRDPMLDDTTRQWHRKVGAPGVLGSGTVFGVRHRCWGQAPSFGV